MNDKIKHIDSLSSQINNAYQKHIVPLRQEILDELNIEKGQILKVLIVDKLHEVELDTIDITVNGRVILNCYHYTYPRPGTFSRKLLNIPLDNLVKIC